MNRPNFLRRFFPYLLLTLLISLPIYRPLASGQPTILAEIEDISDSKYLPSVHQALQNAQESIYVAMYGILVYPHNKTSPPYILLQDLIDAHNRGVKVKVFLDRSYKYNPERKRREIDTKNDIAYSILSQAGVDVKFVVPSKQLHDKLIVIDRKVVISGSTNWSYWALRLNSENADLIRSPEYAREKIENILRLEVVGEEAQLDEAQLITLAVPNVFLKDPKLAPQMVTKHDERAFDLYLLLLKEYQSKGSAVFTLDYEAMAESLGIMEMGRVAYRRQISKTLRKLSRRYRLLECQFEWGKPTTVKLLDYEDRTKTYSAPLKAYFNIPYAYWEYGWSKELGLRAKFAYLINIYKQETSVIKPWWSLSLSLLAQDFHIHPWTIRNGMSELEKEGILEIERGRVEKGMVFTDREPNHYLLKPLPSPEVMEKRWRELELIYGEAMVKEARELAFMIDKGKSHECAEDFIRIIGRYGEEWVEEATREVAKMRADNPRRHFGYIVGILKRWQEQGFRD